MIELLNKKNTAGLVKFLRDLATSKQAPYYSDTGLCANLDGYWRHNVQSEEEQLRHGTYFDGMSLIIEYAEKWPKFSGSRCYPVPDPASIDNLDAEYIYDRHAEHYSNMYDGRTIYGKLRKELAAFIADQLEQEFLK